MPTLFSTGSRSRRQSGRKRHLTQPYDVANISRTVGLTLKLYTAAISIGWFAAKLLYVDYDRWCNAGHVRCPRLPAVDHAKLFYVEGAVSDEVADTGVACTDVTDGNSCHYTCQTGYRLTGAPVVTCQYSGDWLGNVPTCQSEATIIQFVSLMKHFHWRHLTVSHVVHKHLSPILTLKYYCIGLVHA